MGVAVFSKGKFDKENRRLYYMLKIKGKLTVKKPQVSISPEQKIRGKFDKENRRLSL